MHFKTFSTFHLRVCENLLLTVLQILNSWSTGTPFSYWDFPDLVDLSFMLTCYFSYIFIYIHFIYFLPNVTPDLALQGRWDVSRTPPPFSHWDFPGLSTTITHTYISILLLHRVKYCHAIMYISIVLDHALYFPK